MNILEKAKAHYAGLPTGEMEVPEWECIIYWRPWTIDDRQAVFGSMKASGRDQEFSTRVLIRKALDKDGKQIFSIADLRGFSAGTASYVIERIAAAIVGVQATEAEVEKN